MHREPRQAEGKGPGQYHAQDAASFRSGVSSYGASSDISTALFEAFEFGRFRNQSGSFILLDAMSGPGKLGLEVIAPKYAAQSEAEGMPELRVEFNDIDARVTQKLSGAGHIAWTCDVTDIDLPSGAGEETFNYVAVRYGLKDFDKGEAEGALDAILYSLVKGGRIVIGDMTAETEAAQDGLISFHGAKQVMAGRNVNQEGFCYIPTTEEWVSLLVNADFKMLLSHSRDIAL